MKTEVTYPSGKVVYIVARDVEFDPDLKTVSIVPMIPIRFSHIQMTKARQIISGFGQIAYEGVLNSDEAIKVKVFI